jgi:phasin family protein
MQQKTSPQEFFGDVQSTLQQWMKAVPGYPLDMKTMMEAQRKNIQAITEANQRTLEGWQALAQRQAEMMSKMVQNNSTMAGRAFAEGTPQEKIAQQAELVKAAYENTMANSQEIADFMSKCTKETANVINKRVVATLNEIKASTENKA